MPYDPISEYPKNKTQLVKFNKAHVGLVLYNIKVTARAVAGKIIESTVAPVTEISIERPQTNATAYRKTGADGLFWSYYDNRDDTLAFFPDHFTKTVGMEQSLKEPEKAQRVFINEYWWAKEGAEARRSELVSNVESSAFSMT